jgi:hypothetical protein
MSFKSIKFKYTPPPTLPPQSVLAPSTNPVGTATAVSNQFGSALAAQSNAAALVTRLSALTETAAYLQQAIQSLVQALGVTFDLSANPDLGRALARIYNTTSPPSSMDMTMYVSLLEAEMSFLQFDLLNPPDSTVQIEPLQRADVTLVTKAFENALISTGVYNQTLPVLLNSLAGDQIIFNSWSNSLMSYPVLSVPQLTPAQIASTANPIASSDRDLNTSSVDVSDSITESMNGILDQWQSSYAGIYTVVASPDPTETALPSVVATLSTQPTSDLSRLVGMLTNLIAFAHKPAIQGANDSADNQILPRLLSDIGGFLGSLDFMGQVAIGPSATFTGSLGNLMSILSSTNPGSILSVGITGSVAQAAGGFSPPPLTPSQIVTTAEVSEGLQILAANIAWSQNASKRQSNFIQQSMQRLTLRRMTNQGTMTEFLSSMKSLSSSIGIIQSIISSGANTPTASGNTTSLNSTAVVPTVGLQSFGTLVSSLQSQSGSSYAVDGNTLVVTPPAVPTASTTVQSVLAAGGVKQITTQALRTPINFQV